MDGNPIIDINVLNYFKYLHVDSKRNDYFYKKIIRVFLLKYDQKKMESLSFQ